MAGRVYLLNENNTNKLIAHHQALSAFKSIIMRKILLPLVFVFTLLQVATAQETVQYRVILIGDAGEMSVEQQAVLADAVKKKYTGQNDRPFFGGQCLS